MPVRALLVAVLLLPAAPARVHGQADQPDRADAATASADIVRYPAGFFTRYRPLTARDMVEQVPGFQLDDGSTERGFGGSAGNALINGERPSSKQDSISDILERIPAARVARIELIRGNTGRFEGGGRNMLVNVIVDAAARAWTWEATVEQDTDSGGPTPGARISVVDRAGATRWGAGLGARTSYVGNTADELLLIGGRMAEKRDEFELSESRSITLNANTATEHDEWTLRFNAELGLTRTDFRERSERTPTGGAPPAFRLDQRSTSDRLAIELGGDLEWNPASGWRVKVIGLHRGQDEDDEDRELLIVRPDPAGLLRIADRDSAESESIGRLELDWSGTPSHLIELDAETALNRLDNVLALRVDDDGDLVPVPVPGANNRVEELRADLQLRDTWELGTVSLETELGAEASRISQTGGADREFLFVKPAVTLVHASGGGSLNRLRVSRDIAQLDFGDFVSSANFADDDIDRGNPGLEPQQTWRAEASAERRHGDLGVAKLTAFHEWISDVQDLLPIDGRFEVPGNIGDGRRWGLALESTVPLGVLGLSGARLDLEAGWEDSRVIDPLTDTTRRLSGQQQYRIEGRFRQDLVGAGWAWGFETEYADRSTRYELEELDVTDDGVDLETFLETTRYFGVKLRLVVQNVLDREFGRDRLVFEDTRADGDIRFRELRDRRRGRSVLLSVNGSF